MEIVGTVKFMDHSLSVYSSLDESLLAGGTPQKSQ